MNVKDSSLFRDKAIKIATFIFILFLMMPIYIAQIHSGLDASWQYALNILNGLDYVWGKDVAFTYGPLGFLAGSQNLGNNVFYNFIVWGSLFLLHAGLLFYTLFCKNKISCHLNNLQLISSFFLLYASVLISEISPEYYVTYLLLWILSMAWYDNKKSLFLFIACIITVFSLFFKFNSGIMNIASIILFLLLSKYKKVENINKLFCIAFFSIPIFFCIGYLSYNFNFKEMIVYMRDSYEIASGYNSAMSMPVEKKYVILSFIVCIYIAYIGKYFYKNDRNSFLYLILFSGVFFTSYKHGVVRGDHIRGFITAIFLFLSIIVYFIELRFCKSLLRKYAVFIGSLLILALVINYQNNHFNLWDPVNFKIDKIKVVYKGFNQLNLTKDRLSTDFLKEIEHKNVSIYPWEVSFVSTADFQYVPMPVFQAYSAYTPYLDKRNADFFISEKAPQYIVFNLETIDNRYPLIDSPQAWENILKNYLVKKYDGNNFLLEKTQKNILVNNFKMEETFSKDQEIIIPDSNELITAKIKMELNFIGKVVKFLFKIPEVQMQVQLDDGKTINKRVIVENLENDTLINVLPLNPAELFSLLNGDTNYRKVKSIKFNGKGLWLYKSKMQISFGEEKIENTEKANKDILFAEAKNVDFLGTIEKNDNMIKASLDYINQNNYVNKITIYNDVPLTFVGWVFNSQKSDNLSEIYLRIGELLYKAHRINRIDINDHFDLSKDIKVGFTVSIEPNQLMEGEQLVSIVGVCDNGQKYEKEIGMVNFSNRNKALSVKQADFEQELSKLQYSQEKYMGNLDIINQEKFRDSMLLKTESGIDLAGWIAPQSNLINIEKVYIKIGDDVFLATQQARPDVAEAYSNPLLKNSGYILNVPSNVIKAGNKDIKMVVINSDGTYYESFLGKIELIDISFDSLPFYERWIKKGETYYKNFIEKVKKSEKK